MTAKAGLWSGQIQIGNVGIGLRFLGLSVGLTCAAMAVYMVWSSKAGKVAEREKLLDLLRWTGGERVLDVGCGRGLLLVGAAKRLTSGKAVGVDLWQAEDLSGNRPESTLENARREGVADRIKVETGDMRQLPFPDAAFDVIVSKAAIHNLYQSADRAKALAEMVRVLAPGGQVLIDDIRHLGQYEAELAARGLSARRLGNPLLALGLRILTFGSLHPGVLLATRPKAR